MLWILGSTPDFLVGCVHSVTMVGKYYNVHHQNALRTSFEREEVLAYLVKEWEKHPKKFCQLFHTVAQTSKLGITQNLYRHRCDASVPSSIQSNHNPGPRGSRLFFFCQHTQTGKKRGHFGANNRNCLLNVYYISRRESPCL